MRGDVPTNPPKFELCQLKGDQFLGSMFAFGGVHQNTSTTFPLHSLKPRSKFAPESHGDKGTKTPAFGTGNDDFLITKLAVSLGMHMMS